MSYGSRMTNQEYDELIALKRYADAAPAIELADQRTVRRIVAFVRKPSEDGVDCSADREALAQQIEREFLK